MSEKKSLVGVLGPTRQWRLHAADLLPIGTTAVLIEDLDSAVAEFDHVDLLVMELLLCESDVYGDALDVIQLLRRRRRIPIVLFTTAYDGVQSVDRAEMAHAVDVDAVCFVDARGPIDDLMACVHRLLKLDEVVNVKVADEMPVRTPTFRAREGRREPSGRAPNRDDRKAYAEPLRVA